MIPVKGSTIQASVRSLLLLGLGAAILSSCDDSELTRPADLEIVVMTRNLYIGSDLDPLLAVSSLEEVPDAGAEVWADVVATDFTERAEAIADEIAAARPHLVGLQEVSMFRRQSPGDFLIGNLIRASQVELDYLEALLAALEARGLSYRPVAVSVGTDLEGPLRVAGSGFTDDLRLTDREVIIARSDVSVTDIREENYSVTQSVPPGGGPLSIDLVKGWTSVDATVEGFSFRFVSTHLEIARFDPVVQVAQADELLDALAGENLPIVLVGDFNSTPGGSGTPTYGNLIAAGFQDAWDLGGSGGEGLTCCQRTDLRDPVSSLSARVDLILLRGALQALAAEVVGDDPADRTPSGLWPSDHAGVVAVLRAP
jgi:endonuclease/exonuclease/phosphatase family metal-dependent hydrolase